MRQRMTFRFISLNDASAMGDAGQQAVLGPEEKESLRPEKGNAASWPVFWPEEVSYMAVPAKLDELHSRKTAESWADGAESGNWRRLPHNSGLYYLFPPRECREAASAIRHPCHE